MSKIFKDFEADTGKLLNIVINSLYSDRDIFLRELLSNASDAIQKRKYLGLTDPDLLNSSDDSIVLRFDPKKKMLEIQDSGIGLNEIELSETLGTLAKSGTASFLEQLEKAKDDKTAASNLIGKFGVGFYSSFMVADTVEVLTRKAGTTEGFLWTSDGKTGYEIAPSNESLEIGTLVRLFLKKDAKDYADFEKVKAITKKYSDHISVGIHIQDKDGKQEQVNSAEALWTRASKDITKDEYKGFYQSQFGAYDDPYVTLHNRSEGTLEFTNLLFVPSTAPFDLFDPERKSKLNLYINRVFITNDLDAILPKWLRFIQGVLDTSSLDLNVSRELVQSSPVLGKIKKVITKRVISELKKAMKKDPKAYDDFWEQFGKVLKEGLYEDLENREKVADITRVFSNKADANITLQDYVDAFVEGQKAIYYLAADTLDQAKQSAHLEGFKARGIDVLLMTDPIDTFWMSQMGKFKDFSFVSIVRDKYDIDGIGSQEVEGENQEKADESEIIAIFKAYLSELLEDVKASPTLRQSPVRLIAGTTGLDFNLERILKAQNPNFEAGKKVLEVNLGHELVKSLGSMKNEETKASLCRVLLEQARILDGELPSDPQQFSNDIIRLGMASVG